MKKQKYSYRVLMDAGSTFWITHVIATSERAARRQVNKKRYNARIDHVSREGRVV
jgi:hypothetical protein